MNIVPYFKALQAYNAIVKDKVGLHMKGAVAQCNKYILGKTDHANV